jgi:hypothetical protein
MKRIAGIGDDEPLINGSAEWERLSIRLGHPVEKPRSGISANDSRGILRFAQDDKPEGILNDR